MSYNACGVLSHIMFDGPEAWGVCEPQRAEVEERMWAAIQSWDINSRRNINYRCLERGTESLGGWRAPRGLSLLTRPRPYTAENMGPWHRLPKGNDTRPQPTFPAEPGGHSGV